LSFGDEFYCEELNFVHQDRLVEGMHPHPLDPPLVICRVCQISSDAQGLNTKQLGIIARSIIISRIRYELHCLHGMVGVVSCLWI